MQSIPIPLLLIHLKQTLNRNTLPFNFRLSTFNFEFFLARLFFVLLNLFCSCFCLIILIKLICSGHCIILWAKTTKKLLLNRRSREVWETARAFPIISPSRRVASYTILLLPFLFYFFSRRVPEDFLFFSFLPYFLILFLFVLVCRVVNRKKNVFA